MPAFKSAAVSHVGKIRSNNQDSGYAGTRLFVVADGMGGHAGGDVASAIAIKSIVDTDHEYATSEEAEYALHAALVGANLRIAETVFDHSELTGMGTTVSGLIVVGDTVAIAHIGDSRIYRWRDGELEQITADHTFVQRLVDSGRITLEEAAVHPRRSVLMRVLGDVDAAPDIDTMVVDNRPGDRWLICSDGLSSYVSDDKIASILANTPTTQGAADKLVKETLDHGAPDNVTVVLVDTDAEIDVAHDPPLTVGSAAVPLSFDGDTGRKVPRLPALLLHPLLATKPDDSHFEPESDDYLDELIREDVRRARRRRIIWLVGVVLIVLGILAALFGLYRWTQTRYYVGADNGTVAIYQGVQQDLGPVKLSHVYLQTSIGLDSLSTYTRSTIEQTISASSLDAAEKIVQQLETTGE